MIRPTAAASRGENSRNHAVLVKQLRGTYRKIGENLETILNGLELGNLDPGGEKPADLLGVLAMVTIFQYVEGLTDREAADQVRSRADWKYAMHLPQRYPGFQSVFLCDFRRRLISHEQSYDIFQNLIQRFRSYGLFERSEDYLENTTSLILGCCKTSRIADLENAIRNMFGKLAALYPEWLKKNTLPYWYVRYGSRSEWAGSDLTEEIRESRSLALGADAYQLLEIVQGSGNPELKSLREYRSLRYQFSRQFQFEEGVLRERFLCKDGERYLCKFQILRDSKKDY